MGKNTRSFRTTITVPQDLKNRMDAIKEDVNWSALACQAFEAKLGEIAAKKARLTMNNAAAIERLRALKRKENEQNYVRGEELGCGWAKAEATPRELEQLAVTRATAGSEWHRIFTAVTKTAYSQAQ